MVTTTTAVIAAIISFSLGAFIGLVTMGLMTASKVNSLYEELDDIKRKNTIRTVSTTL